jgi:IclR family KDG regulon transcriptional repressor
LTAIIRTAIIYCENIFHAMKNFTIQPVENALNIIELFLKYKKEIGVSELAKLTGLNVSTAHHLATILLSRGYLKQKQRRGPYSLGFKYLEFTSAIQSQLQLRDVADPFLEKLSVTVGESVNLAVLDSREVVYIECIESDQNLRTFTKLGNRVPLYATGVGKIFLANMRIEELSEYLESVELNLRTDNTIVDVKKLKEELAKILAHGYAIDNEEMELGIKCVACAIRNWEGQVVAAISVSGPSSRLNVARINDLVPLINSCSLEISRSLGYKGEARADTKLYSLTGSSQALNLRAV